MIGWILLHRQIQENPLWLDEKFTRGQAWVDLLLLANHKPSSFLVRGNRVQVERGQVARSAMTLAERWRWSKGKVLGFLDDLQKMGMIDRRISNVLAVITIKNYEKYQTTEPQTEPQTDRRPNTYNNEKKENNKRTTVRPETTALVQYIDELSHQVGIVSKVNHVALNLQVERHLTTGIHLRVEVRKCIGWLVDHGKKEVTTQRLTNWFEKAKEIQTREQHRQLENKEAMNNPHRKTFHQNPEGFPEEDSISHFQAAQ